METINQRFEAVIKAKGIRKTNVATALNLSNAFITELCAGRKNPSDRTISDFCRIYSVDEQWLRTGAGEPFRKQDREEEMLELFTQLINDRPESVKRRLVSGLLRFNPDDPKDWEVVEKLFISVAEELKKDSNS